jgi:subtilisin family serine protease
MGSFFWRGARRRLLSAGGSAFLAGALLLSGLVQAVPMAAADSVGEIVVQLAPGKTADDLNRAFGTTTQLKFSSGGQVLVKSNTVNATLDNMQRNPRGLVVWAELNARADDPRAQDDSGSDDKNCPAPPPGTPVDTKAQDDSGSDQRCAKVLLPTGALLYPGQYAIQLTDLDEADNIRKGQGQTIAILDTQVDVLHPVFLGVDLNLGAILNLNLGDLNLLGAGVTRITKPLNLVPNSLLTTTLGTLSTQKRSVGHGTFVAGVAVRAAPAAKIMPVAVLNPDGRGSTAQVAAGIRYAVDNGATVINMSLHTSTDTRVLREAVEYALSKNVVVVAAYGNEGLNQPKVFPADYPGVISAIATDRNDQRASFSNYGRPGVVAAPGVNIISAYPTARYAIGSGTSYSAPWVAGEAAMVRQGNPTLKPAEVLKLIQRTSDDVSAKNGGAPTFRVNHLCAVQTCK